MDVMPRDLDPLPWDAEVKQLGAEGFLPRSRLTRDIREVLCLLDKHRPKHPLNVIRNYFADQRAEARVTRAYRYLRLWRPGIDTLEDCVATAYHTIVVTIDGAGHRRVCSSDYAQLIGMLVSDFSPQTSGVILQKFSRRDHEIISYRAFSAAVTTCLMYENYIEQANRVFCELGVAAGKTESLVPKDLCEFILNRLAYSLASGAAVQSGSEATSEDICQLKRSFALRAQDGKEQIIRQEWISLPVFLRSASNLILGVIRR